MPKSKVGCSARRCRGDCGCVDATGQAREVIGDIRGPGVILNIWYDICSYCLVRDRSAKLAARRPNVEQGDRGGDGIAVAPMARNLLANR